LVGNCLPYKFFFGSFFTFCAGAEAVVPGAPSAQLKKERFFIETFVLKHKPLFASFAYFFLKKVGYTLQILIKIFTHKEVLQ
jgi:hypothetical protein